MAEHTRSLCQNANTWWKWLLAVSCSVRITHLSSSESGNILGWDCTHIDPMNDLKHICRSPSSLCFGWFDKKYQKYNKKSPRQTEEGTAGGDGAVSWARPAGPVILSQKSIWCTELSACLLSSTLPRRGMLCPTRSRYAAMQGARSGRSNGGSFPPADSPPRGSVIKTSRKHSCLRSSADISR